MKNLKNLFKYSSLYRGIFFHIILIFTFLILFLNFNGFLSRYPNEDLFWNDLMLKHKINFIHEGFKNGLIYLLFSSIDFSMGTGENIFGSSKYYQYILNPLNIIYIFFKPLIAAEIRNIIFVTICILGWINLLKIFRNNSTDQYLKFVIIIPIYLSSNIFYFETGILNQFFLYCLPQLLFLLNRIIQFNKSKDFLFFFLIIFMMIGESDLFIFFNLFSFFLCYLVFNPSNLKKIICLGLLIFFLLLISYYPYLYEKYVNSTTIHYQGTWDHLEYFYRFIKPLFIETLIAPNFIGPATIFFHIVIIIFSIQNFFTKKKFSILIIKFLSIFIVLIIIGFFLHYFSFTQKMLPSAVRYHLNIFPFLFLLFCFKEFELRSNIIQLFSLMFIIVCFLLIKNISTNFTSVNFYILLIFLFLIIFFINSSKVNIKLKSLFLILIPILIYLINFNYNSRFIPNKDFYVNQKNLKNYYNVNLQKCINEQIIKNPNLSKSVIFADYVNKKKSRATNHSLLFLAESPTEIGARTFNRWRYSLPILEQNLAGLTNTNFLFNYSFPIYERNYKDIIKFSNLTSSDYLVSSTKINNENFVLLKICKNNLKDNKIIQDTSLNNDIFIYKINRESRLKLEIINVNKMNIKILNKVKYSEFVLPINYHPNLIITSDNETLNYTKTLLNSVKIFTNKTHKKIEVKSFSLEHLIVILTTLIISSVFIVIFRKLD